MATRHMILQSGIILNHVEQELNYKYDAIDKQYQFTKTAKIDFKMAKLGYMSSIVYYLLAWQLVM